MAYDAVIAGASFAGLAVASELKGNVVLIDRKEIGAGQTSTCGMPYALAREIGGEGAILQLLPDIVFHTPKTERRVALEKPYCTIDYGKFCRRFFKRSSAELVNAEAKAIEGDAVITDSGNFKGKCVVDCSGWQAVLASSLEKNYVDRKKLTFGIETVADFRDDAMHFYIDEGIIKQGAGWVFPIGKKSRIGIASYAGKTNLKGELAAFLDKLGTEVGEEMHGGYIPYGLRKPVIENIFVVGDAAGHAMPLGAEGIRPTIYFGRKCGEIMQRIIDGKLPRKKGLEEYERIVMKSRFRYWLLLRAQEHLMRGSRSGLDFGLRLMGNHILSRHLERSYLRI